MQTLKNLLNSYYDIPVHVANCNAI